MAKKLNDLKVDPSLTQTDLRPKGDYEGKKDLEILKKGGKYSMKKNTSVKEINDIFGGKKEKYIYIRGKKFTPPRHLGHLLKIAGVGIIIVLIVNSLNVYFTGKALEKEISGTAYEGYNYIVDAGKSATKIQFENALESFDKAINNFTKAEDDLWFISLDKTVYAKNNNIGYAISALLEGGKHFAIAGKHFLDALEKFNQIPIFFVSKNDPSAEIQPSITDTLREGLIKTDDAIDEINLAAELIKDIKEQSLPTEVRSRVALAKKKVREISDTLKATSNHFPALLKLLGDRYPHRFLILFQNNDEIRPTGGFIGSYGIMDINDGLIEKLETHDVYDIDGSYYEQIEPPEEFKAFTGNWRFRDANFSYDFPTSAKKLRWFLEKEHGPTVDTVIAMNQGLLKDLLEISGPIQVGNFGKLNSENYRTLLSFVIESKAWGPEDPKHILKVFVEEFKKEILKEKHISSVSSKLYKAVQQKHIMAYSSDAEVQELFEAMGLSGKAYQNEKDEDYLSVINIATGGTKSEQFMEEKILHDTYIDNIGNLTDEITLTRAHKWTDSIYHDWKKTLHAYGFEEMPDKIIDIMGRGENKVLTRIYVPKDSILIDSNGADVATKYDKDVKKTYFLVEMHTKAREKSGVWIKYQLPYRLNLSPAGTYKLVVEKQPGSIGSILTKTVHTDGKIKNLDIHPADAKIDENGSIMYATNLVYDRYFSSIWRK